MIELIPLCTAQLTTRPPLDAGHGPTGRALIAEIASARFSGHIEGSMAGNSSADWLRITPGGLFLPAIHLAIRTDDGALLLMRYTGSFRREQGQPATVLVTATFETGDERYRWLTELQIIGKGQLSAQADTTSYEFYQLA
jgi:hypothetical protein